MRPRVLDEAGKRSLTDIYQKADLLIVSTYRFNAAGASEDSLRQTTEGFDKVKKITSAKGWPDEIYGDQKYLGKGKVASLASIVASSTPNWIDYDGSVQGLRTLHSSLNPDAKKKLFDDELTPNEALKLLPETETRRQERNAGKSISRNDIAPNKRSDSPADKLESEKKEIEQMKSPSRLPWIIAGVLLLGILVLLLKIFKGKSTS